MLDQLEHHFILFSIVFLLIGFLLGQNLKQSIGNREEIKECSTKRKNKQRREKDKKEILQDKPRKIPTISIDESTHVVAIKTNDIEKKYDNIGESKTTNENISSSINKLKNLRGEKWRVLMSAQVTL